MFDIEHTPLATTVAQAGKLIDAVIAANHTNLGVITADITPFHSRTVPPISAHDYLYRVTKYVGLENDAVLAVLVYLDRITRAQIHRPSMAISPYNIHRLILSAVVVAHKFHSDIFLNNLRYSKVGGIPLAELNQLELELLFLIKFDLKVDSAEIQNLGEWLMEWPGCLSSTAPFPAHGFGSICLLSQYYDDNAADFQTDMYTQHLSALSALSTLPGIAVAAPVAHSLASTETIAAEADDTIAQSITSNASSAIPFVEMQTIHPNAAVETLVARTRSPSRRQHHPPLHQQQQQQPTNHERSPLELTTPSSMNTVCAPTTPPVFREHCSYEIDYGIPATRSPHVAFNQQRLQHSGGIRLAAGGDHQKWNTAGMTSHGLHPDNNRIGESTLVNPRRRRLQAIATVFPPATITAAATSPRAATVARPRMADLTFAAACNGDDN